MLALRAAQLRAEAEKDYSDMTNLYRRYYTDRPGFWHSDEWRDAVAHVLLGAVVYNTMLSEVA